MGTRTGDHPVWHRRCHRRAGTASLGLVPSTELSGGRFLCPRPRLRVLRRSSLYVNGELEVAPDDVEDALRNCSRPVEADLAASREGAAAGSLTRRSRRAAVVVSRLAVAVASAVTVWHPVAWTSPRYQAALSDAHEDMRRCTLAQPRRASAGLGRNGPVSCGSSRRAGDSQRP
jgi:hypothetical protein